MEHRAVLYCRVSRSTDESVSIQRQEAELRELAKSEGWRVARVYRDDGVSGRIERAAADAALDDLAEGRADVLLVWELSRWSRMGLGAIARLVTVVRETPGSLFVAKKEGLRSDQPAFGIMAAVISEVAAMEAEGTRDRIRSMRQHVLSATEPAEMRWLGGAVPLGYRVVDRDSGPGRALAVDDYEAGVLREVARRFIAGDKLTEVTRWLADSGVPTAQSPARRARQAGKPTEGLDAGQWRITTVRKVLQSPTLIGRTTQDDTRVLTDSAGMPIQRWEPVLDAGTWAQLQARFTTRDPYESRKAASWLSGYLYCALCGSVLYANSRKGRAVDGFRCSNKNIPGKQCPGVSISRGIIEDYMEGVIIAMVGHLPEYRVEERVEGGADAEQLDAVARDISDLQFALVQDGANYAELLPRLDALKSRRRALLEAPGRVVRTATPTGRWLGEVFASGTIAERQHVIADMLDSVVVRKPNGSRRVEDRVEPVWMEHPVEDD